MGQVLTEISNHLELPEEDDLKPYMFLKLHLSRNSKMSKLVWVSLGNSKKKLFQHIKYNHLKSDKSHKGKPLGTLFSLFYKYSIATSQP